MSSLHEMDRQRFELIRRRNLSLAKIAEKSQERERVEHGLILTPRWPLIDAIYNPNLKGPVR